MRIKASLVVKDGTVKVRAYPQNTTDDGSYDLIISTGHKADVKKIKIDGAQASGVKNAKDINDTANSILEELDKIVTYRLEKKWPVSAKIVGIVYKTKQHQEERKSVGSSILAVWSEYLGKLGEANISSISKSVRNSFESFLASEYSEAYRSYNSDVPFFLLSEEIKEQYDCYLRERQLKRSSRLGYAVQLSAVIDYAIGKKHCSPGIFLEIVSFEKSNQKTKHRPIPSEIVDQIYNLKIDQNLNKRTRRSLDRIQRCYIFQIETGLAFACLAEIKLGPVSEEKGMRGGNILFNEEIQKWVLEGYRVKTGEKYVQVLSEKAVEIYKYFMTFPKKRNQRGIFPVNELVGYSHLVKLLQKQIVGSYLTPHMPRHTFATRQAISGVPKDILMDKMGLKSMEILNSVYAQMNVKRQVEFDKILKYAQEMYNQQNRTINL